MPLDEKARYTMRIDRDLLEKFGYIAEYEGRTKNRELEQMIKRRVAAFEKELGEIELRYIKIRPPCFSRSPFFMVSSVLTGRADAICVSVGDLMRL